MLHVLCFMLYTLIMNEIEQNSKLPKLPIRWTTHEYTFREKNSEWFWYVVSAGLAIIIISIFLHNFLLAILAIVGASSIILVGKKDPSELDFEINARGIKIENSLYLYKEMESFYLNYNPPFKKEIIIKRKSKFSPFIKIPIDDTDPNIIRRVLITVLKEDEHEDTIMETIMDRLGF